MEWNAATKEAILPERKSMEHKPRKMWLRGDAHHEGAIKHPGALNAAAAAHGRPNTKSGHLAEARAEEKSPDPHIRSRGLLGARLIRRTI
jgi:hypothetical protein